MRERAEGEAEEEVKVRVWSSGGQGGEERRSADPPSVSTPSACVASTQFRLSDREEPAETDNEGRKMT